MLLEKKCPKVQIRCCFLPSVQRIWILHWLGWQAQRPQRSQWRSLRRPLEKPPWAHRSYRTVRSLRHWRWSCSFLSSFPRLKAAQAASCHHDSWSVGTEGTTSCKRRGHHYHYCSDFDAVFFAGQPFLRQVAVAHMASFTSASSGFSSLKSPWPTDWFWNPKNSNWQFTKLQIIELS